MYTVKVNTTCNRVRCVSKIGSQYYTFLTFFYKTNTSSFPKKKICIPIQVEKYQERAILY